MGKKQANEKDPNSAASKSGKNSKTEKLTKEDIKQLMQKALDKARKNGLSTYEIQMDLTNALRSQNVPVKPRGNGSMMLLKCTSVVALIVVSIAIVLAVCFGLSSEELLDFVRSQDCLVPSNLMVNEVGRPISDCSMCRELEAVPIATSITKEIFLQNYAYSGRPVLIKQATADWLALDYFDYHFFRRLYEKFPDSAKMVDSDCNFLRYQTEFLTFADFLKMDDDKVKRLDWYVGWSNCDRRVMKELRRYYQRPFFLPDDSVSSTLDWIFIGGAGPGAGLHIDVVGASSWQAQIRGEKIWTLVPPYECEAVCRQINVTVKQGDIFVLDTNIWFHRTEILEGEISITIGSEYD